MYLNNVLELGQDFAREGQMLRLGYTTNSWSRIRET